MKNLFTSTLRSQVARRLLLMFIVAALLPATGLGLIVYKQASDVLVDLNYQRLESEAKNIGMSLIQRMTWHQETLQLQVATHSINLNLNFEKWLKLLEQNNKILSLKKINADDLPKLNSYQIDHLRRAKVLMQIMPDGDALMTLAAQEKFNFVQIRLNSDLLWKDEFEGGNYCILTLAGQSLYCTADFPPPPADFLSSYSQESKNSGVFSWRVAGEEHLAAFWRIPLQATLAHEGLIIVVSDTRNNVLKALYQFKELFPAIAVLAMALAILLAIIQIRRQMRPLEQLTRHTRQLSQGNFSDRIEVSGKNEFTKLADAFNSMSEHLNHKFHLLQALGELDRAILNESEITSIIKLLLQHVPVSVRCDLAVVLRFDSEGNFHVWSIDARQMTLNNTHFICDHRKEFPYYNTTDEFISLNINTDEGINLSFLAKQGINQVLAFPAYVNDQTDSFLILAYQQPPQETDEITQAGRSLADRLAAAAINIAWGDKLYHQAHFDTLTDLPNRALLRDRVKQALLRAEREDFAVAVLLIDLDRFKEVNDNLGHSVGDKLLIACAQKLQKNARHTDTVARLGGDEFLVLIPDLPRQSAVAIIDQIANKICAALTEAIDLGTGNISASGSIGIALFPDNGFDIETLIKKADAAMYKSKRTCPGRYHFYSEEMNVEIKLRFEMLQDLRNAIDQDQFFLVYQPKIEATTGNVIGAEALIRWNSPRFGMVSPIQFISLIDELGMTQVLGEWVINQVCAQMATWDNLGHPPIGVSVNISPIQFSTDEIISQVQSALNKNCLSASRLELEILESVAIDSSGDLNQTLRKLRDMNISIALDDFGTGYSSLVYLTKLPANTLKIDQGFIVNLLNDLQQQAIVAQIISLAKILGFKVVAEGVEEESQAQILGKMGCDIFQGYYFSKPLLPADFVKFRVTPDFRIATE